MFLIDLKNWNVDLDLICNVGVGTGRERESSYIAAELYKFNNKFIRDMATKRVVTLSQMRNTLADLLALGGLKNADRYFMPMTPEIEQQMMQQQQQAAQQAQDGTGSAPNRADVNAGRTDESKQTHRCRWQKLKWTINTKCMN